MTAHTRAIALTLSAILFWNPLLVAASTVRDSALVSMSTSATVQALSYGSNGEVNWNQVIKTGLVSLITAGLTNYGFFNEGQSLNQLAGIAPQTAANGTYTQASTGITFTTRQLAAIVGRGVINAGVSSAIQRTDFIDGFISSVVSDYAALGAHSIGDTWGSRYAQDDKGNLVTEIKTVDWLHDIQASVPVLNPNYNPFLQTLAHAGLGATAAWLTDKDPVAGAIGGGMESILGHILPSFSKLNTEKIQWGNALYTGSVALASGVIAEATGHDGVTAAYAAQNAAQNNRQLHPDEVRFLKNQDRIDRFIAGYESQFGVTLSDSEARKLLDNAASAMTDADWTRVYEKDLAAGKVRAEDFGFAGTFIKQEVLRAEGANSNLFKVTPEEYFNPYINLRPLFDAKNAGDAGVIEYLSNNSHYSGGDYQIQRSQLRGIAQPGDANQQKTWNRYYDLGAEQAHFDLAQESFFVQLFTWGDVAKTASDNIWGAFDIAKSAPSFIKQTFTSNEVGPLDSAVMKVYREGLSTLQNQPFEVGYETEYDAWRMRASEATGVLLGIGSSKLFASVPKISSLPSMKNVANAAKGGTGNVIQGVDARTLNRTHSISGKNSSKSVDEIAQSMREGGYKGAPIDVVESNGSYYIIDGHHRAAAAARTGTPVDIRVISDIQAHPSSYNSLQEVIRDAQNVGFDRLTSPGKYKK